MNINKLLPTVQPSLKTVKGSFKQRDKKAFELTETLFNQLSGKMKDDYSIASFSDLQKDIKATMPDKGFKVSVDKLDIKDADDVYDGLCIGVTNKKNDIESVSIQVSAISNSIRTSNLPVFMHEFQHVADEFYNPKYIARSQKLIKKGLENDDYNFFYDDYFYNTESAKSRKKKRLVLKLIKRKTEEFLQGMNISDKLDYLQDMRYCLMSEVNAYKVQRQTAKRLRAQGLKIEDYNFDNIPGMGIFEEKINLLKTMIRDCIKQEREAHRTALNQG